MCMSLYMFNNTLSIRKYKHICHMGERGGHPSQPSPGRRSDFLQKCQILAPLDFFIGARRMMDFFRQIPFADQLSGPLYEILVLFHKTIRQLYLCIINIGIYFKP